jgi:hypothetical protein
MGLSQAPANGLPASPMTYIIQNRIVRILYNERDFSEQLKQILFPSLRNEHQKPIIVIRL